MQTNLLILMQFCEQLSFKVKHKLELCNVNKLID